MNSFECLQDETIIRKSQHKKVIKIKTSNHAELLMFRTDYSNMMKNVARSVYKKLCNKSPTETVSPSGRQTDNLKDYVKQISTKVPLFLPGQHMKAYCVPFSDKKSIKHMCVQVPDDKAGITKWKKEILNWLTNVENQLKKRAKDHNYITERINTARIKIMNSNDLNACLECAPKNSILNIIKETYERLGVFSVMKYDVDNLCAAQNIKFHDNDILKLTELCIHENYDKFRKDPFHQLKSDNKQVTCFGLLDTYASLINHDIRDRVLGNLIQCILVRMHDDGHLCLPIHELCVNVKSFIEDRLFNKDQKQSFKEIDLILFIKSQPDYFTIYADEWVYLKPIYEKECFILKTIQEYTCCSIFRDPRVFEEMMNNFHETHQDTNLHRKQYEAITNVLNMEKGMYLLTGLPGTGKSCVIKIIREILESKGLKAGLCAPTGKAATRLGKDAMTIHKMLGLIQDDDDDKYFNSTEVVKEQYDILIIDESSMIDFELFFSILSNYSGEKITFLFVGDDNQLPSVGYGNIFGSLIEIPQINRTHLSKIFRQNTDKSRISLFAKYIIKGIIPPSEIINDKKETFFTHLKSPEKIKEYVFNLYKQYLEQDITILSPCRNGFLGSTVLNKFIHTHLNPDINENEMMEKEPIIVLKNIYGDDMENSLMNGDIGQFVRYVNSSCEDDPVAEIELDKSCIHKRFTIPVDKMSLAYSLNTHKMQGSDASVVVLILNSYQKRMLNRRLLYTSVTRAKDKLYIVGDEDALKTAIMTPCPERYCLIPKRFQCTFGSVM